MSILQSYDNKYFLLQKCGFPEKTAALYAECDMNHWMDNKPDICEESLNWATKTWSPFSMISSRMARRRMQSVAELYSLPDNLPSKEDIQKNWLINIHGEDKGHALYQQMEYLRGNVESLLFFTPFHLLFSQADIHPEVKEVVSGLVQNVLEYVTGRSRVKKATGLDQDIKEELSLFLKSGAYGIAGTSVIQSIAEIANYLNPSSVATIAAYFSQTVGGARPSGTAATIFNYSKRSEENFRENIQTALQNPFILANSVAMLSTLGGTICTQMLDPNLTHLGLFLMPLSNLINNGVAYTMMKNQLSPIPSSIELLTKKILTKRLRKTETNQDLKHMIDAAPDSSSNIHQLLWEVALSESGFTGNNYDNWVRYADKHTNEPWFDLITDTKHHLNAYNLIKVSPNINETLFSDTTILRLMAASEADSFSNVNGNVSEQDERLFLQKYSKNHGIQAIVESIRQHQAS